jgi:hypothetical protein
MRPIQLTRRSSVTIRNIPGNDTSQVILSDEIIEGIHNIDFADGSDLFPDPQSLAGGARISSGATATRTAALAGIAQYASTHPYLKISRGLAGGVNEDLTTTTKGSRADGMFDGVVTPSKNIHAYSESLHLDDLAHGEELAARPRSPFSPLVKNVAARARIDSKTLANLGERKLEYISTGTPIQARKGSASWVPVRHRQSSDMSDIGQSLRIAIASIGKL